MSVSKRSKVIDVKEDFVARNVPLDDAELGEMGAAIGLDADPDARLVAAGHAAGIPCDKITRLVRCILKCALNEASTRGADVSDEKIAALLAQHGVSPSAPGATDIRDYISDGLRLIFAQFAVRFSIGADARGALSDAGIFLRTRRADAPNVAGPVMALRHHRIAVGVAPHTRH